MRPSEKSKSCEREETGRTDADPFFVAKRRMFDEAVELGGRPRLSQDGNRTRGEIRWADGASFWARGTTEQVVVQLQQEVDRRHARG